MAELAFRRIGRRKDIALDEVMKEALSQVLGVLGFVSGATKVGIERIPVGVANGGKALSGLCLIGSDGVADDAPLGGLKMGDCDAGIGAHLRIVCGRQGISQGAFWLCNSFILKTAVGR